MGPHKDLIIPPHAICPREDSLPVAWKVLLPFLNGLG